MKNNADGFTFLELLAYMAIYGTVSVAIISGISFMLRESNIKKDIAELLMVEKEVRRIAAPLSNYSTDFQRSPYLCKFYNDDSCSSSGNVSLEDFLCASGFSFCKSGNVATPAGTAFSVVGPGVISGTSIAYSFGIVLHDLPYDYCVKFANQSWGKSVASVSINNNHYYDGKLLYTGETTPTGGSENVHSVEVSDEITNAGVHECTRNDQNTFALYYR